MGAKARRPSPRSLENLPRSLLKMAAGFRIMTGHKKQKRVYIVQRKKGEGKSVCAKIISYDDARLCDKPGDSFLDERLRTEWPWVVPGAAKANPHSQKRK